MGEGLFGVDVPEPGMPPIPITGSRDVSREYTSKSCCEFI